MHWFTVLLLMILAASAWGGSFPATSDPTLAAGQRWGAMQQGYVAEGCWHGTSATTTATLPSCRAFVLDTTEPARLQGFDDPTPRAITYSGGDGTYWLGGRANPGVTPVGWTCLPGLHYCWKLSATPPDASSALLVLGKTTVSAGAVGAFTIMAPWRRTTPAVVPAGTTLTLGVCPEAGRRQIFDADGVTTGLIRFGPGACPQVYPEWWGADPTGAVDSTAAWAVTIAAASRSVGHPMIACEGQYLVSAASGAIAVELENFTQIVGPYRQSVSIPEDHGCVFNVTGAGAHGLGAPDKLASYQSMRIERVFIRDPDDTAGRGITIANPVATVIRDVYIRNFQNCMTLEGNMYYGDVDGVHCDRFRERGITLNTQCNGCRVTNFVVRNPTRGATSVHGFRLANDVISAPPASTNSKGPILSGSIEVFGGNPVIIDGARAIDAQFYIENPGTFPADYISHGLTLTNVEGGHIKVWILGSAGAGNNYIHVTNSTSTSQNTQNLMISGQLSHDCQTTCVTVESGPNIYGIDLSRFSLPEQGAKVSYGRFTTGYFLGENYITQGDIAPSINLGRQSWRIGDKVWKTEGGHQTNVFWQAIGNGNPGTWEQHIVPTTSAISAADGDATPTVKSGATYYTRMDVLPSATAITHFDDGIDGQTLIVRAQGGRTLTDGPTLTLNGNVNYVMVAGDTVVLLLAGAVWREIGRGKNT